MSVMDRRYNKKMDRAVVELEKALKDKLQFVSPDQMQDVIQVANMPAAFRMGGKHAEMDIIHTVYGMHKEPFLRYQFYLIGTQFGHKITPMTPGDKAESPPLLYDAAGKPIIGETHGAEETQEN